MPTLRDIKRRIKAVKSTRQITKAMKMVAAAKLRRAQSRMLDLRVYADRMNGVISSLMQGVTDEEQHPLLAKRPRKTAEVLVMTSDRGLCGAFNTNVLKAATKLVAEMKAEGFEVSISIVGKKALDYYKRRGVSLRKQWVGISGKLNYANAQEVAGDLMDNYVNEKLDEAFIIYNEFKNVAQQRVAVSKLLPLSPPEGAEASGVDFIYEPSEKELLGRLLPKNVEIQVYRGMLESQASEEAARMTAMENATKSATEMMDRLTLQYNKARQASITKELMDIVGGVEALKG